MKSFVKFAMIVCVLLTPFVFTGCDDESSGDSNASALVEKGPSEIVYLNNGRSQLVLSDGWTLNMGDSTKISVQRPSCSGFEYANNLYAIDFEAAIVYVIDMNAPTTFVTQKEATPVRIEAYRVSCLQPEDDIQYILDTDRDGYTDNIDAFPNDPSKH